KSDTDDNKIMNFLNFGKKSVSPQSQKPVEGSDTTEQASQKVGKAEVKEQASLHRKAKVKILSESDTVNSVSSRSSNWNSSQKDIDNDAMSNTDIKTQKIEIKELLTNDLVSSKENTEPRHKDNAKVTSEQIYPRQMIKIIPDNAGFKCPYCHMEQSIIVKIANHMWRFGAPNGPHKTCKGKFSKIIRIQPKILNGK
ncbi:hypothetical protein RFI_40346, partial [Reticulomyxa filosa]